MRTTGAPDISSDELTGGRIEHLPAPAGRWIEDIRAHAAETGIPRLGRCRSAPATSSAWLTVRLDGGPIGPDLLDVLAPGYVHASSPVGHYALSSLKRLRGSAARTLTAAGLAALDQLLGDPSEDRPLVQHGRAWYAW